MPVARLAPLQSVVRQLRLTWQSRIQGHPTSDARVDQHLMQRRENGDRDGDLAILLLEAIHSLRAAKLPLDRVSLALVPEQSGFNGVQYQWLVDDPDEVHSFLRLNEFFFGEDHRTSILHHICCTGRPEQLKLQELSLDQISFPLLRDLRRDHFSDYVALPLPAGPTHRLVLTLASRTPGGFQSQHLRLLIRLLPGIRGVLHATEHFGLGRWEPLDPLTEIWSRHHLEQEMGRLIATGEHATSTLSLLLLDLKDFSGYNHEFGHLCADDALASVASQLINRLGDLCRLIARIGSDSFALLLIDPPGADPLPLLEQVQQAVQDLRLVHPSAREPFLSCNLALLTVPTGQGEARHLLTHGELLLAEAQRSGTPRILDDHASTRDCVGG